MVAEARTVTVTIDRPAAEVYEYAADPRNLPAWSFVESISPLGDGWAAVVGDAVSVMRFVPRNGHGVLDHEVRLGSGDVVHVPMRVFGNGAGSAVTLTVFRRPGVDLEADVAAVETDLAALQALLEARSS